MRYMKKALKLVYLFSAVLIVAVGIQQLTHAEGWPYGCCDADEGGSADCGMNLVCCVKPSQLGNCSAPPKVDYCYTDAGCSLIIE